MPNVIKDTKQQPNITDQAASPESGNSCVSCSWMWCLAGSVDISFVKAGDGVASGVFNVCIDVESLSLCLDMLVNCGHQQRTENREREDSVGAYLIYI